MNHNYLRVLYGQVHVVLLQQGYLSEISRQYAFLNGVRVHFQRNLILYKHFKLLYDSFQLIANVES